MRLLVVGVDQVDAGKTTFSTGLIAHTGAIGFKPRAGNDYWYHHDDVTDSLEAGRLVGSDAQTLAAASPGTLDAETINPVHRLWRPSVRSGKGLLGQEDMEFLVDRVGDRYVRNDTVEIPDPVRDALSLTDAVRVASLEEFNAAMEQLHQPANRALLDDITAAERAVVESYSDVARPIRSLSPDAVAVVEPLRARFYAGDRYVQACTVATQSPAAGRQEERVSSVIELTEPIDSVRLPPLTADERSDPEAVAEAYRPAYDRLLDVARA